MTQENCRQHVPFPLLEAAHVQFDSTSRQAQPFLALRGLDSSSTAICGGEARAGWFSEKRFASDFMMSSRASRQQSVFSSRLTSSRLQSAKQFSARFSGKKMSIASTFFG